jgi:hypothetical protein
MPSSDEVIPAAFALHNSPRRYALLVGSGISRDTGILTAGEITDDLIRQIAGGKIPSGQKPQDWYKETHESRAPTFTGLFDELAKSREDRTAILRQYFEPKDRDGNPARIEPSPAHLTIARLVKDGIISMIITTNFDPLLEEAVKRVTGRDPVIITHESRPERMEVAGHHCRIVKVNGNYPDTDLKLTPADLADYAPALKEYLDRIFSEYGLLICGWSGEHDIKLVEILTADRVRRFAIFWCSREASGRIPEEIRSKLHLSTIGITSANQLFDDLESRIQLLCRHERTTSLTIESAVKKVKDALRDPRPELILSDLLHDETDRVLAEVNRSEIIPEGNVNGKACFRNRLEELEAISAPLAAMVATLAYYDDGIFADLITETIERLINLPQIGELFAGSQRRISGIQVSGQEYQGYFQNLRYYPALLTIYASGIAATRKENFNTLSAILENPRMRQFVAAEMAWKNVSYFEQVNIWQVIGTIEQWTLEFSADRFGKQGNPYYYPTRIIQAIISSLIPNEYHFDAAFDSFEYLYDISYLNQTTTEITSVSFPLMSRIWLQTVGFGGSGQIKFPDTLQVFLSEISQKIERSAFFNGDSQRFLWCMWKYGKIFMTNPPKTDIPHPREGFPGL